MKMKFLAVAMVLTAIGASGQQKSNYHITGNITGLEDGWIYKMSDDGKDTDSARVRSGQFTFNGYTDAPRRVFLRTNKDHDILLFFLDKDATIKIAGSAEQFANARVTGGSTQTGYNRLLAGNTGNRTRMEELGKILMAAEQSGSEPDKAVMQEYDSLYRQLNVANGQFVKNNPSSFVSLYIIQDLVFSFSPAELEEMFNGLDEPLKASAYGKRLGDLIAVKKRTAVGQMAIDFTAPDTLAKKVSLSSFRGKYVLLDFWASWCGPCRAENPNVLKAYNSFKDKGFTVLSVSLDANRAAWVRAIREDKLPWTHVLDQRAAETYGVSGIPASFLIDPDGKILAVDLRGDDLSKKLEEVISNNNK